MNDQTAKELLDLLSNPPELPPMPLSETERERLFTSLVRYSTEPPPAWVSWFQLARLVSMPPWELHRCPKEWLIAALELAEAEDEVKMSIERRRQLRG